MVNQEKIDVVLWSAAKSERVNGLNAISGRLFYKLLSALSPVEYPADTTTARVMTRKYVDSIARFSEKELDLWGVFVLAGFNQQPVSVVKGSKGSTTFTFRKKVKRAIEIITSFSHRPLYLTFLLGVVCFFVAFVNVGFILYKKLILNVEVEGWASILASIWFVGE